MISNTVISANNLGKCYPIYSRPVDRLKQALWRGRKTFFNEFWALKDVSFSINKGETVGIVGANGSGKSTLLQLICGTLAPTTGELKIKGRIGALLELGAGFNPEFSGRENVYTSAAIMGLGPDEISACYDEIVEFSGIGHFIDQPVKQYSSGMYVRLAFATAIKISPDILIVDEALAVGDIRFQQKCMAQIKRFCQEGTVIFVSHDTNAVKELCSRAIWIKDGRIQMDGEPKLVIDSYLQYMYEGESATAGETPIRKPRQADEMAQNQPETIAPMPNGESEIRQFGDRRILIKKVRVISEDSCNSTVYAGKPCDIIATLEAHDDIARPIIGYNVRDRLGRELFCDNTALLDKSVESFAKGEQYQVTFHIARWPNLSAGEYVLSIAVADGTMEEHSQCHWMHDLIPFTSIPVRATSGIFSVLDTDVQFRQLK